MVELSVTLIVGPTGSALTDAQVIRETPMTIRSHIACTLLACVRFIGIIALLVKGQTRAIAQNLLY